MYDQKRQRLVEDFRFFYYYDNNGNLSGKVSKTSSEVTNFIHNTQNQLIGIESFDGLTKTKEVRYVYDAPGRRVQKQITDLVNTANSHKRSFGYDGQDLLFEFNESNDLLATYTHSGLRMDDILSADFTAKAVDAKRSKNDGSYFYLKDALGSVKEITDSQGNIVQQYAYSAFGELISVRDGSGVDIRSNPNIAPYFTYTARELDAESGLYYYRARYYDASVGRFLQVDPHPGKLASSITVNNKYVYAGNNPSNYVDPDGRFFGVIGAIAIAYGGINAINKPAGQTFGQAFFRGFAASLATGTLITLAAAAGPLVGVAAVSLGATGLMAGILSVAVGSLLGAAAGGIGAQLHARARGRDATNKEISFGTAVGGVLGAFGAGLMFNSLSTAILDVTRAPISVAPYNDPVIEALENMPPVSFPPLD